MHYFDYKMNIFDISIVEDNNHIVEVLINKKPELKRFESKLIIKTKDQIVEYLEGNRKKFNLDIKIEGSPFQKKVWRELLNIEYGTTISYKDLATRLGNENASRAVGNANNKNKLPIIIPCHRVIASNGELKGYKFGLSIKKKLLELEQDKK